MTVAMISVIFWSVVGGISAFQERFSGKTGDFSAVVTLLFGSTVTAVPHIIMSS